MLWSSRCLEIGMGFLMASVAMFMLGILFLFDRALIVLGNLSFMVGLVMLIGAKSTLGFFIKKGEAQFNAIGKLKGSALFFSGFLVILLLRWTLVGFLLQLYGLFLLFKSFLPFVYDSATKMPVIGRYLSIERKR